MDLAAISLVARRSLASQMCGPGSRSFAAQPKSYRLGAIALGALLAGCVAAPADPGLAVSTLAPVPTSDPLIAFAAGAPGSEGGYSGRYRLTRSYSAASGAECREVQESDGVARLRLVCRDPNGQWREARPLLGTLTQRP
ncbi:MAG: hypothetical protein V4653_08260 [Pseudomonadota bacterium]